jgi:hypothetical protein
MKKGRQCVESGFFLRCLLECYKVERVNRFKFIVRMVKEQLTENSQKLDFDKTMNILGRFDNISYEKKLALYRECYSASRGCITP